MNITELTLNLLNCLLTPPSGGSEESTVVFVLCATVYGAFMNDGIDLMSFHLVRCKLLIISSVNQIKV